MMESVDENLEVTVDFLKSLSEKIEKQLSHSGIESLLSLMDAFQNKEITLSVLEKSVQFLFDNHGNTKQDRGGNNVSAVGAKVDENSNKSGAHVRIRVRVGIEENPKEEDVSEGRKRRIIDSEKTEKTLKKARKSRSLERVTPSYKLIPEEQQDPVSNNPELNCLNNKYSVEQFNGASRSKKLSKYEEAIESCEDDMFETDMMMEALKSAIENAEKVLSEEMRVKDLGVKLYRCIENLYGGDMFEIVREDHKRVLPVILKRLKQKLDELTAERESRKPQWKQVFEENTAKQREATRRKLKKNKRN